MAPKKTNNSKQPVSEPETTQPTPDNGEGPSQPQELQSAKSPTPERDPELEPEDEERMLEKQLAEASKQAHLAALYKRITYEH